MLDDQPQQGSAAAATMAVLEWPRLCAHVARFASTTLGRQAVLHMQVRQGLIGCACNSALKPGTMPWQ